jgi:transposase
MANVLTMAQAEMIKALYGKGWSQRRIARELGLHRDTVARYVKQVEQRSLPNAPAADSKPAISTTGSEACVDSKQAISNTGSEPPKPAISTTGSAGRKSLCLPFQSVIEQKVAAGLSAQRIFQDLATEQAFQGSYSSVRRFVEALGANTPLPFRRMEADPGSEAQIDFGSGAPLTRADGLRRRTHVLRAVLSCSRKGYSEATLSQSAEDFIAALENAFWAWGGVPKTLVVDNLKAAVTHADWYDPELNPRLRAFCQHYGTILLPTRPYTPRHKGKVESGVKYVQSNALKGRGFETLAAQNAHLEQWESRVADLRIHGTTKKQVREIFRTVEQPTLLPLPRERFPFFHEAQRVVHRDGHVEVAKAYYSVPPQYMGRTVWVRWDHRLVRIFTAQFVEIALHPRSEAGRFSTDGKHLAAEKISGVERGATELLRRARLVGPQTGRWAEALLKTRGIEGVRPLVGLLALVRQHAASTLESVCELAAGRGVFKLRALRELLKRRAEPQAQMEFMAEHPVIRSMSDYGALVQVKFQEGEPWREPVPEPPRTATATTG